jgi:dual specificity tyrosine-phosphorylation-regulated kinase 2/3/4
MVQHETGKTPPEEDDIPEMLPNEDTVGNICTADNKGNQRSIQATHLQSLKEKLGDFIDSSGGTIDAIDVLQQQNEGILYPQNPRSSPAAHDKQATASAVVDEDDPKAKLKSLTQITNKNCPKDQSIQYPLKPGQALRNFMHKLSDYEKGEILDYRQIYFLGLEAEKVDGSPLKQFNYGYDDDKGDYKVVIKDHIGYRFEVLEPLGKGSFGQALKCFDHQKKEFVALKIIRNKKKFQHQAGVEVKILKHLRDRDPNDDNNIIRIKDYIVFRKHLCISFELLSIDLYEFIKNNNFRGMSLGLIRRFAIQILQALRYVKQERIIHCDLKPENILLKSINKSGIKIIDFGSSCFEDERIYTYIQSRFYRAPEIILGIPYTSGIDIWSFGCILAELLSGYPLFPGESEHDQLGYIMEICGVPPKNVLDQATRGKLFFDEDYNPILKANSRGKVRRPYTKSLQHVLQCTDKNFIRFLKGCLAWDPEERFSATEALMHEWILEGLPPKVLVQHKKMLGIDDLPSTFLPS